MAKSASPVAAGRDAARRCRALACWVLLWLAWKAGCRLTHLKWVVVPIGPHGGAVNPFLQILSTVLYVALFPL